MAKATYDALTPKQKARLLVRARMGFVRRYPERPVPDGGKVVLDMNEARQVQIGLHLYDRAKDLLVAVYTWDSVRDKVAYERSWD